MLGSGSPGTRNFADYISTCSYGSTQLDTSSLLVINLQLPCSGVSARTNAPWTVTSCQGDSLLGKQAERCSFFCFCLQLAVTHLVVSYANVLRQPEA